MKLKELIGAVAPALASALGGPLAGTAVRVLSEKFLGKPDGAEDEVVAALAVATPEQIVELRRIDAEFRKTLVDAGIKLEELEVRDREGARAMFTATRDPTVTWISLLVLGVWGSVQYALFTAQIPEANADMVVRMLGTLDAALMAVLWFWVGSTKKSGEKTEAILKLAKG